MKAVLTTIIGTCIGVAVSMIVGIIGFYMYYVLDFGHDAFLIFLSFVPNCPFIGAIIGLIYGIYKIKIDKKEKTKAIVASEAAKVQHIQHMKWANEVKQKALSVADICEKNAKDHGVIVTSHYMACSQMDVIMQELANAVELNGKLVAINNDTWAKGGAFE